MNMFMSYICNTSSQITVMSSHVSQNGGWKASFYNCRPFGLQTMYIIEGFNLFTCICTTQISWHCEQQNVECSRIQH